MTRNHHRTFIQVIAAITLGVSGLYGQSVSYSSNSYGTTFPLFTPGANGVPNNTILTGVALSVQANAALEYFSVMNNANTEEDNFEAIINYNVSSTDSASPGDTVAFSFGGAGPTLSLGPYDGGAPNFCPDNDPSASCNDVTYYDSGFSMFGTAGTGALNVPVSDLDSFEGSGTFQFSVSIGASLSFSGGDGQNSGPSPAMSSAPATGDTTTVTYTYAELPEPASLLLIASGLATLMALRRAGIAIR